MPSSNEPDPKLVDWSNKQKFRNRFRRRSSTAFLFMCLGIGILALVTPIILPVVAVDHELHSISKFYHDPGTRDLFVAFLSATGIFLIFFQGLSRWENIMLSVGGVLLVLVAMVPMCITDCDAAGFSWHGAFAIGFFAALFVVAIFFAKSRLDSIIWIPLRERLRWAYNLAGFLMIAMPLTAFAIHLILKPENSAIIFWVEALAIWAFAAYWFIKTYEYKLLLGYKVFGRKRPL